jgi:metal-responsive CopG/Arc/MetJ family transcriptional regulator
MKTAISIPDELFVAAESFAREKGLRRSDLYSKALLQYLRMHRNEDVTEQLNAIYAEEGSALETPFKLAQARILQRDEW